MSKSTFERVKRWNLLCGKQAPSIGTLNYYTVLEQQAARIAEELQELQEAIENSKNLSISDYGSACTIVKDGVCIDAVATEELCNYWNQEILDAGCDLDVVVSGANFLSGHKYDGAIDAVLSNNDVKHTTDIDFALKSCTALGFDKHLVISVDDKIDCGTRIPIVYYSVHRKLDDKICKLIDHPKVDLSPFVNK